MNAHSVLAHLSIRAQTKPRPRLAFIRPRKRCAWYQERRRMTSTVSWTADDP